jgi:hypothetical protein
MLNVVMLNVVMLNVVMLNVVMLNVVMLNVAMLNVIMLNVIMLNVIMLNVILLSVIVPYSFIIEGITENVLYSFMQRLFSYSNNFCFIVVNIESFKHLIKLYKFVFFV